MDKSKALIKTDEGLRLAAYQDSKGIWTIGYGHNMEIDKRFSPPYDLYRLTTEQADFHFDEDYADAVRALGASVFKPAYEKQNDPRKAVMENMMFNMGSTKFAQFKRFLLAMGNMDYPTAAKEMKDSLWWGQVGKRAERLQKMILTGEWL